MTHSPEEERRSPNEAQEGDTAKPVEKLALITDNDYRHALTPVQDKQAFMMPITPALADNLTFENGILSMSEFQLSLADYSPERLAALDFATLRTLYSVILKSIQEEIEKTGDPAQVMSILEHPFQRYTVSMYLPDFFRMIGAKPNTDDAHVLAAILKLQSFNNLIGIHTTYKGGRKYDNQYAVMQWDHYDKETNTITFGSPYLNHIAKQILRKNLVTDKDGKPKLTKSGRPRMKASHSYLLSTVLASERNKRAVEILCYIDYLIETAGTTGVAHAKASTIIHECPELEYALENCSITSDKNNLLRRAFSKAWELMRDPKYSQLCERYKDIQIPSAVPTASTLDMVFEFPHKGKSKGKGK